MEYFKINLKALRKKEIDWIVNFLNKGKVMAYPTDTVYGIGCLAGNKKAINKIYAIKKRDKARPFIILVSSLAMAKKIVRVNTRQLTFLKKVWPGPVSVILESKKVRPGKTSGRETIALRFPDNDFLKRIIRKIGQPLVSTSLNLSGQPQVTKLENLDKIFTGSKPDLIVDAGVIRGRPSKLVDLRDAENIKVLRK